MTDSEFKEAEARREVRVIHYGQGINGEVMLDHRDTELLGFIVTARGIAARACVRFPNLGGVYEFSMRHGWGLTRDVGDWRIVEDLDMLQKIAERRGHRVVRGIRDVPMYMKNAHPRTAPKPPPASKKQLSLYDIHLDMQINDDQ